MDNFEHENQYYYEDHQVERIRKNRLNEIMSTILWGLTIYAFIFFVLFMFSEEVFGIERASWDSFRFVTYPVYAYPPILILTIIVNFIFMIKNSTKRNQRLLALSIVNLVVTIVLLIAAVLFFFLALGENI